jgi:hypothetical protein
MNWSDRPPSGQERKGSSVLDQLRMVRIGLMGLAALFAAFGLAARERWVMIAAIVTGAVFFAVLAAELVIVFQKSKAKKGPLDW